MISDAGGGYRRADADADADADLSDDAAYQRLLLHDDLAESAISLGSAGETLARALAAASDGNVGEAEAGSCALARVVFNYSLDFGFET